MATSDERNYRQILASCGMEASQQRLKILELLTDSGGHPSAQEVYVKLHAVIPSLSKTTVYNTLQSLQRAGLLQPVMIDDQQTRYDAKTAPHGHFKCDKCKRILDFAIDADNVLTPDLSQCVVSNVHVYVHGVCQDCREDIKQKI